jgi:hypothetical protein
LAWLDGEAPEPGAAIPSRGSQQVWLGWSAVLPQDLPEMGACGRTSMTKPGRSPVLGGACGRTSMTKPGRSPVLGGAVDC